MEIRKLKADEIDVRVQSVFQNGCIALLYKDARCDMNILDETFGMFGWVREHKEIKGNLFCTVSVYDKEKGIWIYKEDVGVESYTEKEKGQASDSFKRACFNLGIGRELYTAPFIWINLDKSELKEKNGKYSVDSKLKFQVYHIAYDGNKISELGIQDHNKKPRFRWKG